MNNQIPVVEIESISEIHLMKGVSELSVKFSMKPDVENYEILAKDTQGIIKLDKESSEKCHLFVYEVDFITDSPACKGIIQELKDFMKEEYYSHYFPIFQLSSLFIALNSLE